ncbi:MAG: histidinol dehydrogenase [Nitrospinae bacterium]|nr:histidinol dehydrogenase [Nitrospinota bacterium]
MMKIFSFNSKGFDSALRKAIDRTGFLAQARIQEQVLKIIHDVRKTGDLGLVRYTRKFDRWRPVPETLKVTPEEIESACRAVSPASVKMLKAAASRIRLFHERQKESTWNYKDSGGNLLGQMITPMEKVGLYIPGGKAVYPSTVLMNAIPARVAGVERIIAVSPAMDGELNPHILAAARVAGISEIYKVGGAQAIAALAFGTATVPEVDKIVGPGNIYVAEAKRAVYGKVDIDSIAGPSEILVLADDSGNPEFIAADLLSQAEHDEMASCVLVTPSGPLAKAVQVQLKARLAELSRRSIAEKSIRSNGRIFVVKDMDMAAEISNRFAPEHLELAVRYPFKVLKKIRHAGAVFLGHYTPEALGDYLAGPNHVLPTGGTARFFSPLGVYDFLKRTSLISFSEKGLRKVGGIVMDLAAMEGLEAHGKAVEVRLRQGGKH